MGFLGGIFNDVVSIATAPVKIATKITDNVFDSDLTGTINDIQKEIKIED